MKKALLLGGLFLCIALGSCKKCYMCTLTYHATVSSKDSVITIHSEQCNTGKEGAGDNLNTTIDDIQRNGYTCIPE